MNTRSQLDLTNTPINDLQLPLDRKKRTLSSDTQSPTSIHTEKPIEREPSPSESPPTMQNSEQPSLETNGCATETELENSHRQQSTLEKHLLNRIPMLNSVQDCDVKEFLSKLEFVFDLLKYSDGIRIEKTAEKFNESFYPLFTLLKTQGKTNWKEFKAELPKLLLGSTSQARTSIEPKQLSFSPKSPNASNPDNKPSSWEMLRDEINPFTGIENPRQWFTNIDLKFSQLKLSMADRIEILPYFLAGDATIWFSTNRKKISTYMDFCELFAIDFLRREPPFDRAELLEAKHAPSETHNSTLQENLHENLVDYLHASEKSPGLLRPTPPKMNSNLSHASEFSPMISKALLDRFVKDPVKFNGGKEDVNSWIEEIEQQFNTMNVSDSDRLNLVHICLRGEAHFWYRQNKTKFHSWSIFIDEIVRSFTSNLQRDLAFEKLKKYRQSLHQSVNQYYNTMIKLIKQADPIMNESTKVQYLMNGLRPSLSTETRRVYPKTTADFLEQAKTAEELTTLNNLTVPNPSVEEEFESSSTTSPIHAHQQPRQDTSHEHSSSPNPNRTHHSLIHSQIDRRQHSDRPNGSSYSNWKNYDRSSHTYKQPNSSRTFSTPLSNNRYSTQDTRHPQEQQRTMSSTDVYRNNQTPDHRDRNRHHFEARSQ